MFMTRSDVKVPERCRCSAFSVSGDHSLPTTASGRKFPLLALPLLGPFASISAMSHLPQSRNRLKKEQGTGMDFPEECCVLTDKNCPVLTGFGVRNKKLMGMKNIKVYAVGLYVDPKAAKNLLNSKQAGISAKSGIPEQAIFDDLVKSNDVEKSLRMVISFGGVNQKNFWSALQERLEPPMKKAGDVGPMQEFGALFDDIKFKKGLQLNFTSGKDGALITQVDNKQVGIVKSPLLTRTLFDVYLGRDPVSPGAKESIGRGLMNLAIDVNDV
ncbi:hypothetical protein ABBQ38_009423 [Trebouxia sp. C0009 RCD-2024]